MEAICSYIDRQFENPYDCVIILYDATWLVSAYDGGKHFENSLPALEKICNFAIEHKYYIQMKDVPGCAFDTLKHLLIRIYLTKDITYRDNIRMWYREIFDEELTNSMEFTQYT